MNQELEANVSSPLGHRGNPVSCTSIITIITVNQERGKPSLKEGNEGSQLLLPPSFGKAHGEKQKAQSSRLHLSSVFFGFGF
ncbi:hypothetical protein MHYP_G00121560 [Metynnis hypsauchen]